ncbi:uncharacterized protein [Oscarella lobularis]|uniref:uncharacterized protein isoform X2 n=1 Tax=Oscarella lobularis TaxID=121494 RepID=UPI0033138E70
MTEVVKAQASAAKPGLGLGRGEHRVEHRGVRRLDSSRRPGIEDVSSSFPTSNSVSSRGRGSENGRIVAKSRQRSDLSKNARSLPGFDNFGGVCGHRLGTEWQEVFNTESLSPLIVTVPVSPHVDEQLILKHCRNLRLRAEFDYFEGGAKVQVTGSLYQVDQFAKQVDSVLNNADDAIDELTGAEKDASTSNSASADVSRTLQRQPSASEETEHLSAAKSNDSISQQHQQPPGREMSKEQSRQRAAAAEEARQKAAAAAAKEEAIKKEELDKTETERLSAADHDKSNDSISHDQPLQSPGSQMEGEENDTTGEAADLDDPSSGNSSSTPETFQINKVTFDYLRKIRTTDLTECERSFGITVESDETNCQAGAVSIFIKPAQGKKMHPAEQNKAFESVKALCQQMSQLNFEEEKIPFPSPLFKRVSTATQLHPTSLHVLIEIDCSSSSGVISLIGPKKDLKAATHNVKKYVESLKSNHHQPSSSTTYAQAVALPGKPVQVQVTLQEESEKSMPRLFAKKGSITEEAVDAIVCSNDSHLHFSSGSAKAILQAGGKGIETECRQFLQKYGSLRPGQVVITNAGDLPSTHVFHVVIQGIKTSSSEPGRSLADVFFECLLQAGGLGVKSIAVPALGCGFLNLNKKECVETLLATVDRYWEVMRMTSTLQKILFVDSQEKVVKEFQKQLEKREKSSSSVTAAPQTPSSTTLLAKHPPKKGLEGKGGKTEKGEPSEPLSSGKDKGKKSASEKSTAAEEAAPVAKGADAKAIAGGKATEEEKEDTCAICYSAVASKTLSCGHKFCKGCIDQWFKEKPVCPTCGAVLGKLTGTQPRGGTMNVTTTSSCLPGYNHCGTIQISYYIPPGRQTEKHPHPGKTHGSLSRTAYLPDNKEGKEVLRLLRKAFDARLTFTVGTSRTTGADDQVTWNDIHHKTSTHGGPQSFGYPDPGYLARVKDELKAKGIE